MPIASLFDDLPEFEGRDPIATELTLSGAAGRRTRPFRIGDRLALVVEVIVTGVEHKETKGGIVRSHKLRVEDAYELGGERKQDLLEVLHEEYVAWEDEARARTPLFGPDGEPTDTAAAAAGAGPEERADYRAELAEIEAWANGAALDAFDSSEEALAALTVYAEAVAGDDTWGEFDPDADPEHIVLQGIRTWAEDAVAGGEFPDADAAFAELAEAAAAFADPA